MKQRDLIGIGIVVVVTAGALLMALNSRRLMVWSVKAGADFAERHPTVSRSATLVLFFGLGALAGWRTVALVSRPRSTGLLLVAAAGLSFGLLGTGLWTYMSARNFRVTPLVGWSGFAFSLVLVEASLVAVMADAWPAPLDVFATVTLAATFLGSALVTVALWRQPVADPRSGSTARALSWAFGKKPRL